ncbi:Plant UBX domain-containing protein 12 [Raphanus sativus]|nr:Plant UBX domain-containing protein 12 [Raphanus sativus]
MAKRLFAVLECQSLLENLSPFVDTKRPRNSPTPTPRVHQHVYLPTRLCVRLPDGRKVQRNFLRSESVQLLWSFCYSLIGESERRERCFKLIQAVPGDYRSLYYGSETSFGESGLDNSLISVVWV